MIATLSLMSCVLATAQPADRPEWLLTPRLARAQELVYRGSFEEQSAGADVQFSRGYRFHGVVFVLDTTPRDAEVAFLTILRPRNASRTGRVEEAAPSSVRLEVLRVDPQGRVTGEAGTSLAVPLEGPPTAELGAFVEAPRRGVRVEEGWTTEEDRRPARAWTVAGTETVNATSCVKLVGVQKSEDWDEPRGDRAAWHRQDTVWVAPRLGIAYRVERKVLRRDPARTKPTYESVLRYELDQRIEYPKGIGDDIRREITQARGLAERAAPLLPSPTRHTAQIDALLARIKYHQEQFPAPPPYGEAMLHLQRRLEAARRGEAAPAPPPEDDSSNVAAVGRPAPDFVVPDLIRNDSARLGHWKGKPMLMVFYSPRSLFAEDVLRLAQDVHAAGKGEVAVVGLAMSQDADAVRKQRDEMKLTFPVLNGTGLRQSYAVEATPKVVVIDADGVVRAAQVGWGRETRGLVLEEVRRWGRRP
jgi:hypothetical protein